MKNRKPKIIWMSLLLLGVTLSVVVYHFSRSFRDFDEVTRLTSEYPNPSGQGIAITLESHYYDGPIVSLYIRDAATNNGKPVLVGRLPEGYDFDSLVWSADGKIVAAHVKLLAVQHGRLGGEHSVPYALDNTMAFAYNFQKHQPIEHPFKLISKDGGEIYEPLSPTEQDTNIQSVIAVHGGQGQIISKIERHGLGKMESRQFGE